MGAVTEIYRRTGRRAADAKAEKASVEELIHKATQAFDVEKERADLLAIELRDLRRQRKSEKEQQKAVENELAQVKAENAKLLAANGELKGKYRDEVRRLRDSRAYAVNQERNIQTCLRKSSEATFEKVKEYLRGREQVEKIRSLFGQAKGTRETLELLKEAKVVDVPDAVIASLAAEEEKYAAMARETPEVKLAESELVVPTTFDGIALEVQAQVAGHGSNDGVIDQADVDQLREPEAVDQ